MTLTDTDTDIRKLRTEAAEAGDLAQSCICAHALGVEPTDAECEKLARLGWAGNQADAREDCARVIREAQEAARPAGFRAYDTTTEWMGQVRETETQAHGDAIRHNKGCAAQGGYGSAIVVRPDPEAPGRCVDLDGATVWPPHGRGNGAVRW